MENVLKQFEPSLLDRGLDMKRNPWPYAIAAYFIIFIIGMVGWISFAMRHNEQLVRPDYYEHEIKYQNHIDSIARTAAVQPDIDINYDLRKQTISIYLPVQSVEGRIQLYRPSDLKLDVELPLTLDKANRQEIDVRTLQTGLWKLRLSWKTGGQDYYFEKPILLAGNL